MMAQAQPCICTPLGCAPTQVRAAGPACGRGGDGAAHGGHPDSSVHMGVQPAGLCTQLPHRIHRMRWGVHACIF